MIDDNPQSQKYVARIRRHRSSHDTSASPHRQGQHSKNWRSDGPTRSC